MTRRSICVPVDDLGTPRPIASIWTRASSAATTSRRRFLLLLSPLPARQRPHPKRPRHPSTDSSPTTDGKPARRRRSGMPDSPAQFEAEHFSRLDPRTTNEHTHDRQSCERDLGAASRLTTLPKCRARASSLSIVDMQYAITELGGCSLYHVFNCLRNNDAHEYCLRLEAHSPRTGKACCCYPMLSR
jgi:hypothetical protein